ncbi:MAG: ubiquinol-cytochrome c reductase iron-sulfur subunit [bacterium]
MNNEGEGQDKKISRRYFFSLVGWGSLGATCVGATVETVRFFFPNVLYEPPSTFKVGLPGDYPTDTVTYKDEKKLFIIRDKIGLFTMSAVCTHLGCTVLREGPGFHCPCHGATFDGDGVVTRGPARRPLPRFRVVLTENGELLVDTAEVVGLDYRLKV